MNVGTGLPVLTADGNSRPNFKVRVDDTADGCNLYFNRVLTWTQKTPHFSRIFYTLYFPLRQYVFLVFG